MIKVIFDDAKDKNVANYVIFGDSEDGKLYYSEGEGKVQVSQADLKDFFLKGRLLICVDSENGAYAEAVKVVGNKAYTMNSATVETVTTISMVEWAALAPVAE